PVPNRGGTVMALTGWLRSFWHTLRPRRGPYFRPRLDSLEPRELLAADPTFGGDGFVYTDFTASAPDRAWDVVVQPDGKIVAAGQCGGPGGSDFALVRYNPDGSLDPSFGEGGRVSTDFEETYDRANAVALQADGQVVVAGRSGLFMAAD